MTQQSARPPAPLRPPATPARAIPAIALPGVPGPPGRMADPGMGPGVLVYECFMVTLVGLTVTAHPFVPLKLPVKTPPRIV